MRPVQVKTSLCQRFRAAFQSGTFIDQHMQAFARQLTDFMQIEILNRQGQFSFFRRLLNYDDWRVAGWPQSTQFLDYQLVNWSIPTSKPSAITCGSAITSSVCSR